MQQDLKDLRNKYQEEMPEISTGDYIPYPELQNKDFNKIVYSKKEFNKNKYNPITTTIKSFDDHVLQLRALYCALRFNFHPDTTGLAGQGTVRRVLFKLFIKVVNTDTQLLFHLLF